MTNPWHIYGFAVIGQLDCARSLASVPFRSKPFVAPSLERSREQVHLWIEDWWIPRARAYSRRPRRA